MLRTNYLRLALLPLLVAASLLLPTLHLHPDGGQVHQQPVIHADFLSVSAQDHGHAQQKNVALGDSSPWVLSQSGLSALTARNVDSLLTGLEKSPESLLVDLAIGHTQLVLITQVLKRDHPPPVQQVLLAPSAPRSPPRLV